MRIGSFWNMGFFVYVFVLKSCYWRGVDIWDIFGLRFLKGSIGKGGSIVGK